MGVWMDFLGDSSTIGLPKKYFRPDVSVQVRNNIGVVARGRRSFGPFYV
jgi:hypothetical protein